MEKMEKMSRWRQKISNYTFLSVYNIKFKIEFQNARLHITIKESEEFKTG